MSSLRRRLFGDPSSERLRTPSLPSVDLVGDEEHVTLPLRQLKHINNQLKSNKTKGNKRRNAWIFGLGGLFGILVAGYFAGNNDIIDLPYLKDMNLESLLDVLPAGLIRDANELQVGASVSLQFALHIAVCQLTPLAAYCQFEAYAMHYILEK